jgi:hypothetical protein
MQTAPGSRSLRINRLTEQIQAVLSAIGRPVSLQDSRDALARDAESNQRRNRRADADAWFGLRAGSSAHPARDNCGADLACGPNGHSMPSSSARRARRPSIERPSCHCDLNRSTISGNHTRCASPLGMLHDSITRLARRWRRVTIRFSFMCQTECSANRRHAFSITTP